MYRFTFHLNPTSVSSKRVFHPKRCGWAVAGSRCPLRLCARWDAPRFVALGHALGSLSRVCDRRKLHLSEPPSRTRGEDRRRRIPWELRRAIPVPCISWAVINDLVHTLNLLQRQVQIVISKLFHFLRLCWHEAAHWAVVPQTSPATRDKPTKSLACYSKHHEIDWKIMCLLKTPCMKLLNVPIGFWTTF